MQMKSSIGLIAAALMSGTLLAQQPTPTPYGTVPADQATAEAPTLVPTFTPTPTLVENLIKLWKANLSEDFLKKYIDSTDIRRDLTAEDIVRLRNAGIPENLISAVAEHKPGTPAAPGSAGAAPMAGAPTPTPAFMPAPTPTSATMPATTARWEGLARRNGGVVIMKSRWDGGVLEFKEDTLRWTDGRDAKKNVLLTSKQITEQQLTCLKKAGGNECFEWVVKTKNQDYRFRDISWEQGEDGKVLEIYKFMQALYPSLVSSHVPVDEKEK
jgi:hypothetical protein